MAHLVWLDTKLLTHEEEACRYSLYRDIQFTCGWTNGKIIAQLPTWDELRKMVSARSTGEIYSAREESMLANILNDKKSIYLAGLNGKNYENIAQNTPLIDYMLTDAPPKKSWCQKYKQLEEFLTNPPKFATDTTWSDPVFLKRLDLLVIGSTHIDFIDQYLPLDGPNPLFDHLIKSFGAGGPLRRYLCCRPEIRLHFCERPKDDGRPAVLSKDETTGSLLRRMGSSRITEAFSVVFALWKKGKHHDRKIIGDIGGLHLGRGSSPTSQPFAATPLSDPKIDRYTLELEMENKRGFDRCLP